jgi:undecaprenyl-diphosphatase
MHLDPAASCFARCALSAALALGGAADAIAGGGPFGIDSVVEGGANGIFQRKYQVALEYAAPLVVVGSALWEGDGSPYGHTSWQATDSLLLAVVTSTAMKAVFTRSRPSQGGNPDLWFQGAGHYSFPSAEVMEITTAVTPYILQYSDEHPAVWALELLPVYDAVARVRSQAHWQSDVLASFAIGTVISYYSHSRTNSFTVGVLPHGLTVGWKRSF